MDVSSLFPALSAGLGLFKDAVSLVKETKELLPESDQKQAISKSLEEAEKATQVAEAQIAQALGYKLCQCTFPPQIMLSTGYQGNCEYFKCPKCGKTYPPNAKAPSRPSHNYGIR